MLASTAVRQYRCSPVLLLASIVMLQPFMEARMLFGVLLDQVVKTGSLRLIDAKGRVRTYGDGSGPTVSVCLHKGGLNLGLAVNPYLKIGEAYMDGSLTIEPPHSIYDFLDLLLGNLGTQFAHPLAQKVAAFRRAKRWIDQYNPLTRARQNIAHHYDLDGGVYDLFLDADKNYSCAYFNRPSMSLEDAQLAKKAHIAAKLGLRPGMKVLDIGCGWGGLALYMAEQAGVDVVGVTLSEEQYKVASRRAEEAGLADRVVFKLQDYRTVEGQFDRIVSVGMFEHVGAVHFDEYFRTVRNLLTSDGTALIHTIGRLDRPGATNPWIAKYIFPGGYIPALSEVTAATEGSGLLATDLEILRLHYAETLRHWRKRFVARRQIAAKIYDERFCRMWEFYLAGSETSFRHEGMAVFQLQIAKQIDTLPLTRDYMLTEELAYQDGAPPRSLAVG